MSISANLSNGRLRIVKARPPGPGLTTAAAALTALGASAALVVWIGHLDGVMALVAGTAFAKANGALALLLAAGALLLADGRHVTGRRRTAAYLLATGCLAIAGATTVEWLSGVNLGIDQAILRDWSAAPAFPGRPTFTGSLALVLLATGILAGIGSARLGRIRDICVVMVVSIGLLSLIGWLTGVSSFVTDGQISPAPLLTACGVTLCAVALFAAGHPGSPGIVISRGPVGSLARRLLFAVVVLPLALSGVAGAAERDAIISADVATAFVVVGTIIVGGVVALITASVTGRHIQELAASAAALQESEQRQRMLIENLPQAIVFKDLSGTMLSANPAVRAQLHMEPEELIGKRLVDLMPPDEAAMYAEHERTAIETRQAVVLIEDVPLPNGLRTLEIRNIPTFDKLGHALGLLLVITDITAQREAGRSKSLLAAIVNSTDEAISSSTREGLVSSWNAGAEHLYGWTAAEAIGAPRSIVVPPELIPEAVRLTTEAMNGKRVMQVETVRQTRDGQRINVSLTVSAVVDEDGGVAGYSLIARDISARKRSEAELSRTREELERSNRELQDFASVASHDLQEPLRKIRAFGDRLVRHAGASLDPESRDDVERIQGAAARMQQLIEDLLTYARVTSRAQPFVPVDLAQTVAEVLEDLETSVAESGGSVTVGALPTLDADPSQMRQLLQNLIGNGLKFHPADRAPAVTVNASAAVMPGTAGTARHGWLIEIADNGIGFEPRFAERIFAPFERLHSRAEFPGTGIGLAICRKIAERHHGTITVSSTPGSGTTFHVLLPAVQVQVPDPILPLQAAEPAQFIEVAA